MSTLVSRAAVAAAVAASLTGLVAAPAHAAATLLIPPAVAVSPDGSHGVVATCAAGPGVSTNLNQVTYPISVAATGYSTTLSTPVAIGVACWIVDAVTNQVYGTISQRLPGSVGAASGTITVPFNSNPKLCVRGSAGFSDNTTVSATAC